jgi:hypothetical protein
MTGAPAAATAQSGQAIHSTQSSPGTWLSPPRTGRQQRTELRLERAGRHKCRPFLFRRVLILRETRGSWPAPKIREKAVLSQVPPKPRRV